MTPTLTRLTSLLVGAGAVGVLLELTGIHSPVRSVLVLVFIAVAPTAAFAGLLRGFDGFARIVIAFVTTIVVLSLIAIIMLAAGLWSPTAGLLVVVVISAGCLLAQLPGNRARVSGWAQSLRHASSPDGARVVAEPADAGLPLSEGGDRAAANGAAGADQAPADR